MSFFSSRQHCAPQTRQKTYGKRQIYTQTNIIHRTWTYLQSHTVFTANEKNTETRASCTSSHCIALLGTLNAPKFVVIYNNIEVHTLCYIQHNQTHAPRFIVNVFGISVVVSDTDTEGGHLIPPITHLACKMIPSSSTIIIKMLVHDGT